MRGAVARIAVMACVLVVAGGCGADDRDDASAGSGIFDPCQDIKDSVLKKAGFDPATKKPVAGFALRCSVDQVGGGGLVMDHIYGPPGTTSAFDAGLAYAQQGGGQVTKTAVNGRDAYAAPQTLEVLDQKGSDGL